jgi:putative SOS response-associated peptidase YedK
MCGRFVIHSLPQRLAEMFEVEDFPSFGPSYNLAPSQLAPVIRAGADDRREALLLGWGLVPGWADDPAIGQRMINARSETAAVKPSFREALRSRRCLVPANGFYEWLRVDEQRQPCYVQASDNEPFAMAGLWETWRGDEQELQTFTVLTTNAGDDLVDLHHRAPVILAAQNWQQWLERRPLTDDQLRELCGALPPGSLHYHPVSPRVNKPANDDPGCLEAVTAPLRPAQASLFDDD